MAITFDSSFEGGNGTNFSESPTDTANVTTECDPSPAPTTWGDNFYFKLSGVNGIAPEVKIDLDNDRNGGPFLIEWGSILPYYSYDQINWVQVISTDWASEILTFTVPNAGNCTSDDIFISFGIPYTYTDLIADIATWVATGYLSETDLGDSSDGRTMYYLTLGTGPVELGVTCRCHPDEPQSSWLLKGALDFLTSDDALAIQFRSQCKLHIFPMVNPDGVYKGKMRAFDNGEDANRDYDESGPNNTNEEDETFLIHTQIHSIQSNLAMFLDMHGAWAPPNVWRDPAEFSSDIEAEIETQLPIYDTNTLWDQTFNDHSNAGISVNTTWRDGIYDQYGIPSITAEGSMYKFGGGELTKAEQQEAGEVFFKATLKALVNLNEAGGLGNDFSGLVSLINLFNFESGALGDDEGSGGDDLAVYGGAVASANPAPNQKPDSYSLDVQGTDDTMYILDNDLSVGHPFAEADGAGDWTIFGWVQFDAVTTQHICVGKYSTDGSYLRSFWIGQVLVTTPDELALIWATTGGGGFNVHRLQPGYTITTGRWYHIQVKYDESEQKAYARVWDNTADDWLNGSSAFVEISLGNTMHRSNAIFSFGGAMYTPTSVSWDFDGRFDEWGVCDEMLSDEDLEAIKNGTLGTIVGSVCWGHVTGVTQDNTRTFAINWTGTGTISGSGDSEIVRLKPTEYVESEVVNVGIGTALITLDEYQSGEGAPIVKYKDGDSEANCEADTWNTYTVPFVSQGYVKIRLEK